MYQHLTPHRDGRQPAEYQRQRVLSADSGTLLEWLDRILVAESLDALLH